MRLKNIILLVCVVVFAVGVTLMQIALRKDTLWVQEKTAALEQSFAQAQPAEELYAEIHDFWARRITLWGMLLPHHNLLDVSQDIEKLGAAMQTDDQNSAVEAIYSLRMNMQHLLDRNSLKWEHVF
ncbi:MAG: DUF4363 family protein [Oscillospiraceae bacterium]|jgi:hypothetical protein|nr:DUF4363 family protein [Oscillospiraceae bacterium]